MGSRFYNMWRFPSLSTIIFCASAHQLSLQTYTFFYFTGTGCVSTQSRGCAQHVLKYVVILLFQKMNMFFVIEFIILRMNCSFFYLSSRNNVSSSFSSSFVSVYGSSLTFLCPNRISSLVNNFCART